MAARSGGRVLLRAPVAADMAEFTAAMRASRTLHRPWIAPPLDAAAFEALVARAGSERYEPMLLCARAGGEILGFFNISEIVRGSFRSAFLGYGAVEAHAGRGYMTEGLQLVLARAFAGLRLHRLEANIQPGNDRSIGLVRRAGFVREGYSERYLMVAGRWRDHERWAITAERWRAAHR